MRLRLSQLAVIWPPILSYAFGCLPNRVCHLLGSLAPWTMLSQQFSTSISPYLHFSSQFALAASRQCGDVFEFGGTFYMLAKMLKNIFKIGSGADIKIVTDKRWQRKFQANKLKKRWWQWNEDSRVDGCDGRQRRHGLQILFRSEVLIQNDLSRSKVQVCIRVWETFQV